MSTKTAPAAITIVTGKTRNYSTRTDEVQTAEVKVGDFLSESLVTDTLVSEVVKVTKSTITIRSTSEGQQITEDEACDKTSNGLGVVWQERVSNPEGSTRTLRLRKDGTVRTGSHTGARPLRPAHTINGVPVARRDWRF